MMENQDRELLELAAKAAGEYVTDSDDDGTLYVHKNGVWGGVKWNPLTDDGDALRLAVKLELIVSIYDAEVVGPWSVEKMHEADKCEATRRAIVRAAAEIGKAMK